MSYSTKYRLSYTDFFAQSVQIDIMQSGYSGAVTEINGAGEPLLITHDTSSDFLFDPILGTWVTLRLYEDTVNKFQELFTSDGREWKVIIFIAGSAYFKGFILPDYYQSPYKHVGYHVEVIAADQLGLLRNYDYDYYQPFEIKRPIDMLATILNKTDLELDIREGVNIYEDGMNQTAADSPLDQCWIDQENYSDSDGKPLDCYIVLKDLLLKFCAVIRQVNGQWHIWRPSEAVASYTRRQWEWEAGAYSYANNASYNPIVSTTSTAVAKASLVRIMNEGTLFLQSGYKDYNLIQNYGPRISLVKNHDFIDWIDSSSPTYWSKSGATPVQIGDRCRLNKQNTITNYIYQSFDITKSSTQVLKLRLKFQTYLDPEAEQVAYFYVEIKTYDSAGHYWKYWDFSNNSWSNDVKRYTHTFILGIQDIDIEVISSVLGIDQAGKLHVFIYEPYQSALFSDDFHVIVDRLGITVMDYSDSVAEDFDEENENMIAVNALNNLRGDEIEILTADLPGIQNTVHIYGGGIYLDENRESLTNLWEEPGREEWPLLDYLKEKIGLQYAFAQKMLSVNILTKLIIGDTTIREINDGNKLFHINRATWNQKSGIWQCELTENKMVTEYLVDEEDEYIYDEEGQKIQG
jgi:hypothetical protein